MTDEHILETINTGEYRAFIQCLPDAVVIVDANGRILMVNSQAEKLFGYEQAELTGKPHQLLIPERFRDAHKKHERSIFQKPKTRPMGTGPTKIGRRKDGSEFSVDISISPIKTKEGLVVLTAIRDITGRMEMEESLRASKDKLRAQYMNIPIPTFTWRKSGKNFILVDCNIAAETITGGNAISFIGKKASDIYHDIPEVLSDLRQCCRKKETIKRTMSYKFKTSDEEKCLSVSYAFVPPDSVLVHTEDITQRMRAEEALLKSEEGLVRAQQIAHVGNWDWNIETNELSWSDEVYRIFGLTPREWTATFEDILKFVHPEDRELFEEAVAGALKGQSFHIDHRIILPDGSERVVKEQAEIIVDENGKAIRMAGIVQDITGRRQAESKIEFLAYHDPATSLPNRRLLKDRLNQILAWAEQGRKAIAVLRVGLDRFKRINEVFGHDLGDQLLRDVGLRLSTALRKGDTLANVGGDEFVVVLPNIAEAEEAARIATSLFKSLSKSFDIGSEDIFISAGIGISVYPTDGRNPQTLVKNADAALDIARKIGRNSYKFYTSKLNSEVNARLSLETNLVLALERGQFIVYYQPHVNINSGKIVGMEALVRWRRSETEFMLPSKFIATAEATGLIAPIGEFVLRTACHQNKAWQDAGYGLLTVSVNLSARQLERDDLVETVERIIEETKLAPHYLDLELTETAIMKNVGVSVRVLNALRSLGLHIAIDDFGIGYSSLESLTSFPIEILKIDRRFIKDLTTRSDIAVIVRAIISLGHALKLTVIAEGVETKEQLEFLRSLKSDAIQGFLFSRPVPARDFERLLKNEYPFQRRAA